MAPFRKKGGKRTSLFSPGKYDSDNPAYSFIPSTEDIHASSSYVDEGSDAKDEDEDEDDNLSTTPQDLDVLREEEEREKLLSKGGLFGSIGRREGVLIGKRVKSGSSGRKRRADSEERAGGGGGEKEYITGTEDESEDQEIEEIRRGWVDEKQGNKRPRFPSIRKILAITAGLLTFLLILIYASLQLSFSPTSNPADHVPFHATFLSNGTHTYHPTTIIISLDGFRADYLTRKLTPTLQSFINSGVSAPYLIPSFPSVTFPNHWTVVTGLYPESHGIVGNSFYDPIAMQEYHYTDRNISTKPFWYGGSPIWSVSEENEVKTAIHMWPGSEMYIYHSEAFASSLEDFRNQSKIEKPRKRLRPSIVDGYDGKEPLGDKAALLLSWLDLPLESRPKMILGYVPDIDAVGHKFGPKSPEEDTELIQVDDMFRRLLEGIEARNLTEIVNIVVVSDHGMAATANERLIYLEDVLGEENMQKVSNIEGWPLVGIRFIEGANETQIWQSIVTTHSSWPPNTKTGQAAVLKEGDKDTSKKQAPWEVYHRDLSMPPRLHFSQNPRIAPVWVVPRVGWVCVTEDDYPPDDFPTGGYHPKGVHGYDNMAKDMRALFVGYGPGFRNVGLHGKGREWLGLGGAGAGGENLDVHDAVDDSIDNRRKKLKTKRDINGEEVQGKLVKPFGNWELYALIGELVFGPDMAKQVLGPHNGTLGLGSQSVLSALQVLEDDYDMEGGEDEDEDKEIGRAHV